MFVWQFLVELLHKRKEVAVTPDVKANIFYQVWFRVCSNLPVHEESIQYVVITSEIHGVCQIVWQEYGYGMEYGILCTAGNVISHCFLASFVPFILSVPSRVSGKPTSCTQSTYIEAYYRVDVLWPLGEAGQYKAQSWLWVGWYVPTSRVTGIAMKNCYRSIF